MSAYFEAYITNLGKYNEGALVGEYLKFPTTTEEVQALLKRIGIDGVRYEEIFITDYDGDMPELYSGFGEYESIDELNYLASLLSEMDESDLEKFEAVLDTGEHSGSVKELINLTQNLDCFEFYSGITSEEELGRLRELLGIRDAWLSRYPHELSGGELQRFCIARALGAHPSYLIADEVSTMLDAVTQAQIWRALVAEAEARAMGLIFVSHSPALASRLATRVVELPAVPGAVRG